jgi:hypothetical protein
VKKSNETHTTTVVTETETRTLTAFEERVLRMRTGRSLAPQEPLGSKLDGVAPAARAEVVARLALMEAQLLSEIAPDAMAEPVETARKRRIIEALRGSDDNS